MRMPWPAWALMLMLMLPAQDVVAGKYRAPDDDATVATIEFTRSVPDPGARSLQKLSLYRDAQCTLGKGVGYAAGVTRLGAKRKVVRLPAQQRIFLWVTTSEWTHGGKSEMPGFIALATQHDCMTLHSFVPEPGHRYSVSHRRTGDGCALDVEDMATALQPADLSLHNPMPCSDAP